MIVRCQDDKLLMILWARRAVARPWSSPHLHLTSERNYKLHINLKDFDNKVYTAVYDMFKVLLKNMPWLDKTYEYIIIITFITRFSITVRLSPLVQVGPGDEYKLAINWFNSALSTLGDSFTPSQDSTRANLNGMKFTTRYDAKHHQCKLS